MITIIQGNDRIIKFKKKLQDGSYLDFTLYDNVMAILYTSPDYIAKYSLVKIDGFNQIELDDNYSCKIWFETKNMRPGRLHMEIRLIRNNPELSDNNEDEIDADIIGEVIPSRIYNL